MRSALGTGAAGVFSTSSSLYEKLHKAGCYTGDRVWRMPLFKLHTKEVTGKLVFEVNIEDLRMF